MTPRARILDIPEWEYHRDPCDTPSLSSSLAHVLSTESEEHAWTAHPKFGAKAFEATPAMMMGTLIHRLLLGKGASIEVIEADNFMTKDAKERRDAALADHRLPVLARVLKEAQEVAVQLRKRIDELGFPLSGDSELPIAWTESGAFGDIECRALLDHLVLERAAGVPISAAIYDVKTCSSANPESCGKRVYDYGYDIQAAAYTRAVAALYPELEGRITFTFLFCELERPFVVTPARCGGTLRRIGESRWERALSTFAKCIRENRWRPYTDRVVMLEAPPWAMAKELGEVA